MSPEEFLESRGIKLDATCLITIIDGYMRQPDLCVIMEQYANLKIKELGVKLN